MFTHIPVLKTIDIIYEHLIKSGLSYDYVDEFEKLILVCVQHNIYYVTSIEKPRSTFVPTGEYFHGPLGAMNLKIWPSLF